MNSLHSQGQYLAKSGSLFLVRDMGDYAMEMYFLSGRIDATSGISKQKNEDGNSETEFTSMKLC